MQESGLWLRIIAHCYLHGCISYKQVGYKPAVLAAIKAEQSPRQALRQQESPGMPSGRQAVGISLEGITGTFRDDSASHCLQLTGCIASEHLFY